MRRRAAGALSADHRERGTNVEADVAAALRSIRWLTSTLAAMRTSEDEAVTMMSTLVPGGEPIVVRSTLGRELLFVVSHTIHHQALIGLLLSAAGCGVPRVSALLRRRRAPPAPDVHRHDCSARRWLPPDVQSRRAALQAGSAAAPAGGIDGHETTMPIDPQGGGSWIAAADGGLSVAMLNRMPPRAPAADQPLRSRGEIVASLASSRGLEEIMAALERIDPAAYRAFQLVAVAGGEVVAATSDSVGIDIVTRKLQQPVIFTSSSLGDSSAELMRVPLFQAMVVHAEDQLTGQRAFHAHRWPRCGAFSVVMCRADARTSADRRSTCAAARARSSTSRSARTRHVCRRRRADRRDVRFRGRRLCGRRR